MDPLAETWRIQGGASLSTPRPPFEHNHLATIHSFSEAYMKRHFHPIFSIVFLLSLSFLSVLSASPVLVEASTEAGEKTQGAKVTGVPPWKHKFGFRVGDANLLYGVVCVFYENQLNPRFAIRPALEYTEGDDYLAWFGSDSIHTQRVGVALDGICYLSRRKQNGTGLYGLAGLGVHRTHVLEGVSYGEHGYFRWEKNTYIGNVPVISLGLGCYFGRFFGTEVKYSHYDNELAFPRSSYFPDISRENYYSFTLNFRFPMPGMPKGNW